MPKRNTVVDSPPQRTTTLRRSPRFLPPNNTTTTQQTPQPASATTLPKSQRLLRSQNSTASENPKTPKPRSRCVVRSLNPALSAKKTKSKSPNGSRKSPRLDQSLRRSSRIWNRQLLVVADEDKDDVPKKMSKKLGEFDNGSRKCRRKNLGFSNDKATSAGKDAKDGDFVDLPERESKKSERVTKKSSVGVEMVNMGGGETKMQELVGGIRRKRKRDENGFDRVNGPQGIGGVGQGGWTKEQEMALQRAYLLAKPTPHFWKKVSKLVPGKSAQECFDRVHSEQITPPQPPTRSRANVLTNSSPLGQFSLSASKLLKPTELKAKRPTCNKQRSHIAQKTVRKLLQKHYQVYQDCEADLFSVLEPSIGPSTESQPSVIPSTPKKLPEKQGVLQKCITRSSGHKPLSRFSSSCGTPLVSPPVLKQVRNKVWHEKYIDQLHNREAKRKAASTCTKKWSFGIDNRKNSHVQKVDVVRTAKIALVSDARDAISKLQHLQVNAMENSSDLDDDAIVSDDEENEDDT